MRTKKVMCRRCKKPVSRRTKRAYLEEVAQFVCPVFSPGDIIKKPGSPKKGMIIENHRPCFDGNFYRVARLKTKRMVDGWFTPIELYVLGYEKVGECRNLELVDKIRTQIISTRKRNKQIKEARQEEEIRTETTRRLKRESKKHRKGRRQKW